MQEKPTLISSENTLFDSNCSIMFRLSIEKIKILTNPIRFSFFHDGANCRQLKKIDCRKLIAINWDRQHLLECR
jgi:hypothetical protein